MSELWNHIYVFLLSMVPVLELRFAIPVGFGLGLPIYTNYLVSVLGNFLPVPFILLFIRRILEWMKTTRRFSKIALWLEEKAEKHSDKVTRYATFGLFLFVAIPLPGTGAWTGALVAALLRMRMKYALPSILLGVMTAGLIMVLATYSVVGIFNFFFP
ncbi:MAG: small multi-drug export protein [Clostridia bacterium]|nr:small multi-drug export protein [Clostridia bacterium]